MAPSSIPTFIRSYHLEFTSGSMHFVQRVTSVASCSSFDYQTVFDKFKRVSSAVRLTDSTDLVARLALRQKASGLAYFTDDDGNGKLDRLFVEQPGGRATWGTDRKPLRCRRVMEKVLQFDPTWGSNCYGMKLSMFVTVDMDTTSTKTSMT